MSDPLRIALACEGPTDFVVIRAAVKTIFPNRELAFQLLQPEYSAAFVPVNPELGLGWSGVYRWCRQTSSEGAGRVSGSILFQFHDVLVVHVDADVAGTTYQSAGIQEVSDDLPCSKPCPPAADTTDALRQVMLRWMGETAIPARCVFCTPSKSTEAWVIAALYPKNRTMEKQGWECYETPEAQLGQQPKKRRIRKSVADYTSKEADLSAAWPALQQLSEAARFTADLKEMES
jgi:hypothetical protein